MRYEMPWINGSYLTIPLVFYEKGGPFFVGTFVSLPIIFYSSKYRLKHRLCLPPSKTGSFKINP